MEEEHRLAMGPDLGIALAEHAGAVGDEPVAGGDDVVDLVAEMMDAAVRVALEEGRDGRFVAERPSSSTLVLGSSMNTVVTPCSG